MAEKILDITGCPADVSFDIQDYEACGTLAEVKKRYVLESTDGPIEHQMARCLIGHVVEAPTSIFVNPNYN